MLGAAASLLNVPIIILDQGLSPAKQILAGTGHVEGSFTDPAKIRELATQVDLLTIEIEHVDVSSLEAIQKEIQNLAIHPAPSTIRVIQDKYLQKQHLFERGCPLGPYLAVEPNQASLSDAGFKLGYPFMLKSRTMAYDGRGNFVVKTSNEIPAALEALSKRTLYVEKWVPFLQEIAVMVVRTRNGDTSSYPAVETVHKDNICHLVFAPLRSPDPGLARRAQAVAESAVKNLEGAGVYGVEMFLLDDGTLYVNEIAPRPHNSGHYTIEACETSQYENHLRAILGLPLGSTSMKVPSAAMLNLIGFSASLQEIEHIVSSAHTIPGTNVHLYGKTECRKGRKMGHITVVGDCDEQIRERLRPLLLAAPESSRSEVEVDRFAPRPQSYASGFPSHRPLVGIIMGSDSDLPVMLPAARILDRFQVPYELTIVSAHRTADRMVTYARGASGRGLKVIIAGAGGAAHLPGMVASMTALPVIGVPVKGSSLDGVDSLHSIVQMPRGIPVATVAINGGMNAGLLAVRILGVGLPRLVTAMEQYLESLQDEVLTKVDKLAEVGWEKYGVKRT